MSTMSRASVTNGYGVNRPPFVGCASAASAAPWGRLSASSAAATRGPASRCASAAGRLRPGADADALTGGALVRTAGGVGVALDSEPHERRRSANGMRARIGLRTHEWPVLDAMRLPVRAVVLAHLLLVRLVVALEPA